MTLFRGFFLFLIALLGASLPLADVAAQYVTETRTLSVGGTSRTYLLARPNPMPATPLPLVISLHGDGGNSAGMRSALPIEAPAAGQAVFAYPKSASGAFEYWSDAGRSHEGQFVQQIIASLQGSPGIDAGRVYLVGFSGGATMANALGCRLGRNVIRGLGIHSGTLYPVQVSPGVNDFGYTGNGGVDCDLPAAILLWGMNDNTAGVSYANGVAVRNNYLATQNCAATTTPFTPTPCAAYDGCAHRVNWCAVAGLGHAVWGSGGPPRKAPPPPSGTSSQATRPRRWSRCSPTASRATRRCRRRAG